MSVLDEVQKRLMLLYTRRELNRALTKIIGNEDRCSHEEVDKQVRELIGLYNKRFKNLEVKLTGVKFPDYDVEINFKGCRGYYIETDCGTEFDCGYNTIIDCEDCKYGVNGGRKDPEATCNQG